MTTKGTRSLTSPEHFNLFLLSEHLDVLLEALSNATTDAYERINAFREGNENY